MEEYWSSPGLSYDDVLLVPANSNIGSRSEVRLDTRIFAGVNGKYGAPFVSAPMDTVSGEAVVAYVSLAGGLGILHRFMDPDEQVAIARRLRNSGRIHNFGVAVGIREDPMLQVEKLRSTGCYIYLIDVANGYMEKVSLMIKEMKDYFKLWSSEANYYVIAGNVCTYDGAKKLAEAGADAIRVGIGNGSVCTTRTVAGVGMPQITAIQDCYRATRPLGVPIIADGGIRNSSDIIKALAAGANSVMIGRLLAGTEEAPGTNYPAMRLMEKSKYKVYRGAASKSLQTELGLPICSEGVTTTVNVKGTVLDVLSKLKQGIQSGMSYCGAYSIQELQEEAMYVRVTSAGREEERSY